jgi:DNA-binding response OmpR family regulator
MIQRPRLLAIDDDPDFRKWLGHVLRARFFVVEAEDGCVGYSRAISAMPDIVLLDRVMGGWDGLATLKKFREHPKLRNVPILMLTADASRETVMDAIQSGATDYVLKTNLGPLALIDKLATAFERTTGNRMPA